MLDEIKKAARPKAQARSGVTNGKSLFAKKGVDGRTAWARRFRDLVFDLGAAAGGLESLNAIQVGLVRRAASLAIAAEKLEHKLALGEPVDLDALSRLASNYHRLAQSLGIADAKRPEDDGLHIATIPPAIAGTNSNDQREIDALQH